MNILFLTLTKVNSLKYSGIYTDLLRKFATERHKVYAVCPTERRDRKKTYLIAEEDNRILNVRTLNLQKTNIIEKGLGTLAIEYQFLYAIKKYFKDVKFDLVLYATPPITFSKIISYIKKKDHAYAYLMLKDIFPQNAIDMQMLKKGSLLHQFFSNKEKQLYQLSDTIGCMSEANSNYLKKHHPDLNPLNIEVNPNSIEPKENTISREEKETIRAKFYIPKEKKVFVYGGNLGKPQGLDFLLTTIANTKNEGIYFLIVGNGTAYQKIEDWFALNKPSNAKLIKALPKVEYDLLLSSCDVGLIFLHQDFTIPNFPSRLLSYLEMKMPILAATDTSTDVGLVIENAKCGFWVKSGDTVAMQSILPKLLNEENNALMGERAWELLQQKYTVDVSYQLIMQRMKHVS